MKRLSTVTLWGIYSVWRRHAKVYQKTWLVNFLAPLSEPLVYLVAFGYGLTPLVGEVTYTGETISYREFIAPGMMGIALLFQSFFEAAYGSYIRLSYQKNWQALLTAPLSFSEVFLGEWFWAATKGIIAGTLTGVIAILLGLYQVWHLLLSIPIIILGGLTFAAFGLLTAGTVRTVDQINVPIFLIIIPMFTLCGTYFPRETLPSTIETIASILPLAALIDLLRWPLGVPRWWLMALLWLLFWMFLLVVAAAKKIYPRLID